MIYCVHCDASVMEHNNVVEGKDILICPMCGSIYMRNDNNYKYLGKLSGGNAAREFSTILRSMEEKNT